MPWSIFTDGGGSGAARTWAVDLLHKISAPTSAANQQMIYDWEVSEGGGGKFNPLNQGTDPGNAALTSTGNQYGGGAADYVSWAAGLQGAADYLAMPSFKGIADALRSNNPTAARADLIASPWAASHYGGGAAFSDSPLPGQASALAPAGGSAAAAAPSGSSSSGSGITGALSSLNTDLKTYAIVVPVVIGGAALVVWGMARMTGIKHPAADAAKIGAFALWTSTTSPAGASGAGAPSSRTR